MPTYAVVSDIHANYPALEAVIDDSGSTDGLICLGDMVGLYGFPQETISTIRGLADHCVVGNHDVAVLEYEEGHVNDHDLSMFELEHTHDLLDDSLIEWVNGLPSYQELREERTILAHARPYPEESDGYSMGNHGVRPMDVPVVAPDIDEWYQLVLLGHTHKQHSVDCSRFSHDVVFCNPGSVGQPMDGPARYAIVDTTTGEIEHRKVDYDHQPVIDRLRELDVPLEWWH